MLDKILKDYDYKFPEELIAQNPKKPRDSARLLVYNLKTKKVTYDTFKNIGKYLPENSVLVFNETKVVPARLMVQKPTGGKAELLYISQDKNYIKFLSNRPLKDKSIVTIIHGLKTWQYELEVIKRENQFYFLKPNFPLSKFKDVMSKYGKTPLPPYIKHSTLSESQRRKEYQTVFAKAGLSVAAPTASLHFTKNLISSLKKQGIEIKFVNLNVNLGTFAPLREENLKTGLLHSEDYEISAKTAEELNEAKKLGKTIIAVGTTSVRTLESAAQGGYIKKLKGDTKLFIRPGYKFQFTDGIITNFHVPKSSLMMLISAKTGRKELLTIYQKAIKQKFRLFSFGDGMLILPKS